MDGRRNNGGYRPGSGRNKTKELAIQKHLDAAVSEDDWQNIIKAILEKAITGSLPHAEALLNRKFGKPTEAITTEKQNEQRSDIDLTKVSREALRELEQAQSNN